jgi:O-antigen/teichoic acid export membrane protein
MLKNIGSNWFLLIVTVLCTYFLMPFNLHRLGTEQYGHWLLIASLTGYLTLLQLGVPMASVRHMAKAIAENDLPELNRLVASCAGLHLGLGTLVALFGIPLLFVYEHVYSIPPELRWECRWAFILVLINLAAGFFSQFPYAILNSYQDFVRNYLLATLVVLLRTGLNVGMVLWYPSVLALAIVQLATTFLEMIILWTVVLICHRSVRYRPRLFSMTVVREVLGFSIYVLILSVGAHLAFQTDAIIIGHFLGPAQIPVFSVGSNLLIYLMQFVVGIGSVVMPLATTLHTQGKLDELRAIFLKWSKLGIALTWMVGVYLLIFGPAFLGCWVGHSFEAPAGRVLHILLLSYMIFLPVRAVALTLLMGIGQPAWPTLAFLGAGVLNLILSVALVGPLGLDGVAWGTSIPNILLGVVLLCLACRALDIPVARFLVSTLPRALVGVALTLFVAYSYQLFLAPRTFLELVLAGLVSTATFVAMWVIFVLSEDPDIPLPRFLRLSPTVKPTSEPEPLRIPEPESEPEPVNVNAGDPCQDAAG